jgi:hypothetical protein
MATANDIINDAALYAGLGDQYNAQDGQTVTTNLRTLNDVIDEFGTDQTILYDLIEGTVPMVVNQAAYQLGPGLGLNVTPRIIEVISMFDGNGVQYPCTIIGPKQWAQIAYRASTGRPKYWYIEWSFPNVIANAWPTPAFSTDVAHIFYDGAIASFPALTTVVAAPQGFLMMFKTQLAMRLAVINKTDITSDLRLLASNALTDARAPHKRPAVLQTDMPRGLGDRWGFNWYNGEPM